MAVYIDNARIPFRNMLMCHMIADTLEELNAMADKIGVDRNHIQAENTYRVHYDICLSKRDLAINKGAKQITQRELGQILNKRRKNLK